MATLKHIALMEPEKIKRSIQTGIDSILSLDAQFPTSGQLVNSFVTYNGLSEPTSIVNINNMGSPGTLVYGGSGESNGGQYHFIVQAFKLHFSSGEGLRRSCNYVRDSRYFTDDIFNNKAIEGEVLSPRMGQSCTYVLEGIVAGGVLSLIYSRKIEVNAQGESKLTETRRDNSHYWFGIDPKS